MAKGKVTAVVAVREGSQRVPKKNIREFGGTTLLDLKLRVLKEVKNIDEIIVNTDSDEMLSIADNHGVHGVRRESYFASSAASNSEFHGHIAETTDTDVVFLAPVCSPFISSKRHEEAIDLFMSSEYDSLTSVSNIKGHLWMNDGPLNYSLENVPNSQDLPDVLMLNYGISLIERRVMLQQRGLVGLKPGFKVLSEFECVDVNTMFEFELAEMIYLKRGNELLWR